MTRFRGNPPPRGATPSDPVETYGYLLDLQDRAKAGWVLDTATVYATLAFANEDVSIDAGLYAQDIIGHLPGNALKAAADQVIAKRDRASCLSLANQARAWLYTVDASKADRETVAVVIDAYQRADLYSAAYGHPAACERTAVHAMAYARAEADNAVLRARYVAVALGMLDRAHALVAGNRGVLPVQGRLWLDLAIGQLQTASDAYADYRATRDGLTPQQGEADPIREMLSDMPDVEHAPDVDVQSDIEALLDVADPTPVIPQREPPTLVVISSLDHLPESKSQYQNNPRAEFASMAGVAMPLAETPDLYDAAMALVAEMPWAREVVEVVLMDCVGSPAARIRPTLLVGRPGCGKTRLARRLGEVLGLQPTIVPAAGVADASFGGTSRQWGTARSSVPLQTVRRTGIANPLVIIDELEKAGTGTHNGNLLDVLIPFLERESSCHLQDPYVECAVNLSRVGWVFTANSTIRIPGPLLDRLRIIEVPQPRRQDLPVVVHTIMSEIRAERMEDKAWLPDLDPGELELVAKQWTGGSLRPLRRMLETVLAGRLVFAARH